MNLCVMEGKGVGQYYAGATEQNQESYWTSAHTSVERY